MEDLRELLNIYFSDEEGAEGETEKQEIINNNYESIFNSYYNEERFFSTVLNEISNRSEDKKSSSVVMDFERTAERAYKGIFENSFLKSFNFGFSTGIGKMPERSERPGFGGNTYGNNYSENIYAGNYGENNSDFYITENAYGNKADYYTAENTADNYFNTGEKSPVSNSSEASSENALDTFSEENSVLYSGNDNKFYNEKSLTEKTENQLNEYFNEEIQAYSTSVRGADGLESALTNENHKYEALRDNKEAFMSEEMKNYFSNENNLNSDDIAIGEALPFEKSMLSDYDLQNSIAENYFEPPNSFQGNTFENLSENFLGAENSDNTENTFNSEDIFEGSENYFNDAGDIFPDRGLSYSFSDNAFNNFENSEGDLSLSPVKNSFENALNNVFENESFFENTSENTDGGKSLISELLGSEGGSSQSITNNINPTINLYTGGQSLENDIEEIAEKIGELLLEVCEGSCGGYYK
ncbi:MAG: hypothetical protein LUG66_10350 [Clostridiales bacterium]|nr:hypothetical protein [Clostridiales bacterium]